MTRGNFQAMNVVEEIVDIRERLARMEGSIEHLVRASDRTVKEVKQIPKEVQATGNIVIPIAVVTVIVNAVIAIVPKLL